MPTLAHHALAQAGTEITPEEGVKVYQYIDDVFMVGSDAVAVGKTQANIIDHLENLGLKNPTEKINSLLLK